MTKHGGNIVSSTNAGDFYLIVLSSVRLQARTEDQTLDVAQDGLVALVDRALSNLPPARLRTPRAGLPLLSENVLLDRLKALMQDPSRLALPLSESLVAITPAGAIIGIARGNQSRVVLDPEFDGKLPHPGTHITLVHNHPRGASLSVDDLGQLSKPGVVMIAAIGHDGSLYAASRGAKYDANRFEEWQYPLARQLVVERLNIERPSRRVPVTVIDMHFEHLVALALERAGAIRYRAELGPDRWHGFAICAQLCTFVPTWAGDRLKRAPKQQQ